MIYVESFSVNVADGTSEGDEHEFTPQAGNNWELKWFKPNCDTDDHQTIIHEIVERSITKEFMGNNIPGDPDLIPNPATIESGQDYGFRFTNNTGGTARWTVSFAYEIVTPGG